MTPQEQPDSQAGDELDKLLESLYNAAWVEGNNYDDTLEQAGIDAEVRSEKELRWCRNIKAKVEDYAERLATEARIDELNNMQHFAGTGTDVDIFGLTERQYNDRIATLTKGEKHV